MTEEHAMSLDEQDDVGRPPGGDSFPALWRALDQERKAKGWTRDRLARTVERPLNTVHDRMRYGRAVPWGEGRLFVEALGLDVEVWKARWQRAEERQEGSGSGRPPSAEPHSATSSDERPRAEAQEEGKGEGESKGEGSGEAEDREDGGTRAADTPPPRRPRRKVVILFGAGVIAVAAGAGTWWLVEDGKPKQPPGVACAVVKAEYADVFRSPGDAEPLARKLRGDEITLPRSVAERNGPDGRHYRMVRTPTRTSSGYAYMLAGTLKSARC
jgi:hypothetical protein